MGGDVTGQVRCRYYACEGFSVNTREPLACYSFSRWDARWIILKSNDIDLL
jgi:hypothetical protein